MHHASHHRAAALIRATLITLAFAVLAAVGLAAVQHVDRIRSTPPPVPSSSIRSDAGFAPVRTQHALLIAPAAAPMSTAAFQRHH